MCCNSRKCFVCAYITEHIDEALLRPRDSDWCFNFCEHEYNYLISIVLFVKQSFRSWRILRIWFSLLSLQKKKGRFIDGISSFLITYKIPIINHIDFFRCTKAHTFRNQILLSRHSNPMQKVGISSLKNSQYIFSSEHRFCLLWSFLINNYQSKLAWRIALI